MKPITRIGNSTRTLVVVSSMITTFTGSTDTHNLAYIASKLGLAYNFPKGADGKYTKLHLRADLSNECKRMNGGLNTFDMVGFVDANFADYADVCVALWLASTPTVTGVDDDQEMSEVEALAEDHHDLAVQLATPRAVTGSTVINSVIKALQTKRDEGDSILNSIVRKFRVLNASLSEENNRYQTVNDGLQLAIENCLEDNSGPLFALQSPAILAIAAPPTRLAIGPGAPSRTEAQRLEILRAEVKARRAAVDAAASAVCGGAGSVTPSWP